MPMSLSEGICWRINSLQPGDDFGKWTYGEQLIELNYISKLNMDIRVK